MTLRSLSRAEGCSVACAVLLLASAGCGRIADDPGTGGASSSGGASTGSGGVTTASGGQVGAGGSLGGTGSGGSPFPDLEQPEIPLEEYLDDYQTDGPFQEDQPDLPSDYVPPLPLGEPGWRDTSEPFCSELPGRDSAELWADDDGVAVLTAASCPLVFDGGFGNRCVSGAELWYNDGTGWQWIFGLGVPADGLAGVAGGDLVIGSGRAIALGRDGVVHGGSPDAAATPTGLFGVPGGPAYVLFSGYSDTVPSDFYRYDGDWQRLGAFPEGWTSGSQLTVTGDTAFFVGDSAIAQAKLGADFKSMPVILTGYEVALAGLAPDRLWAAAYSGQVFYYDGEDWIEVGTVEGPVRELLAIGDEVYFVSESQFGRVTETDIEVIQELDAGQFYGLAGVSQTEVFVSVIDADLDQYKCGDLEVFVYDGDEFHQF